MKKLILKQNLTKNGIVRTFDVTIIPQNKKQNIFSISNFQDNVRDALLVELYKTNYKVKQYIRIYIATPLTKATLLQIPVD